MEGISHVVVGYSGGSTPSPTYKSIGDHSEAIRLEYDPSVLSYEDILRMFWDQHRPMPGSRAQYRSAIFTHNEDQRRLATKLQAEIMPSVTKHTLITGATDFFR